ncbi:hypothetical protein J4209_02540, partial [Candidatus Woesearchaeota archaeon]|nr:hypothetical protein [Candidatus Woesearchaeota archaeon]
MKLLLKEKFGKIKPHIPYIILLILLPLLFYQRSIHLSYMPGGDYATYYSPMAESLKQSLTRYHDPFQLWNPNRYSGTPYFFRGNTLSSDYLLGPLVLIIPSTFVAVKLNYLIDIILAGIFMYILMINIKVDRKFAFIAALIFLFNGFVVTLMRDGWLTTLNAYAFMPLVLLFTIKLFGEKKWVKYSIITGIVFALQIRAGPDLKVFTWTFMAFLTYAFFYLARKNFVNRLIKTSLISLIVLSVLFGLIAQRALPTKEFLDMSSREKPDWEQFSTRKIEAKNLFNELIEPIYEGMPKIQRYGTAKHIGITAFILIIFVLYKKWNNRLVLSLSSAAILSILIATASPLAYFLWRYIPPFDYMRYISRALVLFVFCGAVLAGMGAHQLFLTLKKRFDDKKINIIYLSLVALILLNLTLFNINPVPWKLHDPQKAIENNHILQYISKQRGIFRIQTYETRGIDWGTDFYNIPLGLEHIYSYEPAWYQPYWAYLIKANSKEAKLWGILNMKYLTSKSPIENHDFKLVNEFEKCYVCFDDIEDLEKAYGPYLYENELFLPRAYFSGNAVLVFGKDHPKLNDFVIEFIMQDFFDPKHSTIVIGRGIPEDLKKFGLVVVGDAELTKTEISYLRRYVSEGGVLSPNIFQEETTLNIEDIEKVFDSFKAEIKPIDDNSIITHSFERKEIKLNGSY